MKITSKSGENPVFKSSEAPNFIPGPKDNPDPTIEVIALHCSNTEQEIWFNKASFIAAHGQIVQFKNECPFAVTICIENQNETPNENVFGMAEISLGQNGSQEISVLNNAPPFTYKLLPRLGSSGRSIKENEIEIEADLNIISGPDPVDSLES